MLHLLNSKKGFTLIEIMIGTFLMGIVLAGMMSLAQLAKKSKVQVDSLVSIVNYKTALIAAVRGTDSFAKSAAGNTCLLNRTGCGAATTPDQPISILDNSGAYLTNILPYYGFTRDLKPCTTFPSTECPFRYETSWKMVCKNTSCAVPQIKFSGVLKTDPNDKSIVNTQKYSFEITVGQFIGNFEQSCKSLGGNYIPGEPPKCDMPYTTPCPSGSRVTGLKRLSPGATPTTSCAPLIWAVTPPCPFGNIMVGINMDGTPNCKLPKAPGSPTSPAPPGCVSPTDPACDPWNCQKNPTDPSCPGAPGPAMGFSGDGDGGCGDGGC